MYVNSICYFNFRKLLDLCGGEYACCYRKVSLDNIPFEKCVESSFSRSLAHKRSIY